jgi:hypothetical protein
VSRTHCLFFIFIRCFFFNFICWHKTIYMLFFLSFFFFVTKVGTHVQTILPNQATQLMLTLLKWTACLLILTVSSFLPQDQLTRSVWFISREIHRMNFCSIFSMCRDLLANGFL